MQNPRPPHTTSDANRGQQHPLRGARGFEPLMMNVLPGNHEVVGRTAGQGRVGECEMQLRAPGCTWTHLVIRGDRDAFEPHRCP